MKMSDKGLVELVGHEGICLTKYNDRVGNQWSTSPSGKRVRGAITIGSGLTRTEIPDLDEWPWDKAITMEENFKLKAKALKRYEKALNDALKVDVAQHVFDALVSWCYNVGTGWVRRATVIKRLNNGESLERAAQALMFYKKPKEIIPRRMREARLLQYGTYSHDGKALLFPVSSKGYPIYSKGKLINVWQYIEKKDEEPKPVKIDTDTDESVNKEVENSKSAFTSLVEQIRNFWRNV